MIKLLKKLLNIFSPSPAPARWQVGIVTEWGGKTYKAIVNGHLCAVYMYTASISWVVFADTSGERSLQYGRAPTVEAAQAEAERIARTY